MTVTKDELVTANLSPRITRSYTIPSGLYEIVKAKAASEGHSVSRLITQLFTGYVQDEDLL